MSAAHVILVPGLLGFQKLGPLSYFTDVEALLRRPFDDAGIDTVVTVIRTPPTSSVHDRAARLAEVVAAEPNGKDIHIVGHSTGGLDCRVFLSPGISLPTSVDVEAAARRVRAYVTVSTPHLGSPLASSLTGMAAVGFITVISRFVAALLHAGWSPERLVGFGKVLLQLDRISGVEELVCRFLAGGLEKALTDEHHGIDPGLHEWLHDVAGDSALLDQLTPSGVAALTEPLRERPEVVAGSVVTRSPPPRLQSLLVSDAFARGSAALYSLIHRMAGKVDGPGPVLTAEQRRALEEGLGSMPEREDNDGFVPTRSQAWGSVVAAVRGDHLDLMGYYGGRPEEPRLDMLASGSSFDWRDFEATWLAIGRFLVKASR